VSQYLDLHRTEAWGEACIQQYDIAVAMYRFDMDALQRDRDAWKTLADARQNDLERASRWYTRPVFNLTVGAVSVLVIGGLTATLIVAI
jgi:hypothetical protein